MQIKMFCSGWGIDHLSLRGMLTKIKDAGFDGVEFGIPTDPAVRDELRTLLDELGLDIIAHQYQAVGHGEAYAASYVQALENAASFQPLLINSHTGKDFWSMEENCRLVDLGQEIEDGYGMPVVHETHRGRFLYSTAASKTYFDARPNLRINADLSHWTCVSESLLEDQPDIIEEAIRRTEHVHARVGHAEGPQVPDPRAPEWQNELECFTGWWQRIADRFRQDGRKYLTITPEFGPPPYTWLWPDTQVPAADFFELNCWMKDYLARTIKT